MNKIIAIIVFSILIISCQKDIENITIKGTLFDKSTHKPLKNKNIIIEIECWKYGNSPDESYNEHEKKYVKIDSNGNYTVNFNKGAFVTFQIFENGYSIYIDNLYINKKQHIHDIYLANLN